MTRAEETVRLLISSGTGPQECRICVRHIVDRLAQDAEQAGVDFDSLPSGHAGKHGPASVSVTLSGSGSEALASRWTGTVQWTAQSKIRPHHRRRNWFAGVFRIGKLVADQPQMSPSDVRIDTLRAGGPGGQHQNTTDSAVRATHLPSGLSVVARNQRSQHRNRQAAMNRLADKLALAAFIEAAAARRGESLLHHQLERGNPVRQFKGDTFEET